MSDEGKEEPPAKRQHVQGTADLAAESRAETPDPLQDFLTSLRIADIPSVKGVLHAEAIHTQAEFFALDQELMGELDEACKGKIKLGDRAKLKEAHQRQRGTGEVHSGFTADVYTRLLDATIASVQGKPSLEWLEVQGGLLGVGTSASSLPSHKFLIRTFHREILTVWWKQLLQTLGLCIIGSPGIGKTASASYFVHKYVTWATQPNSTLRRFLVLILPNVKELHIFDIDKEQSALVPMVKGRAEEVIHEYKDKAYFIHDLGRDAPLVSQHTPALLLTSFNYKKINEATKEVNSARVFAPMPDDEAMQVMADAVKAANPSHTYRATWVGGRCASWQDAAYYYGNCPRYVFGGAAYDEETVNQLGALKIEEMSKVADTATSLVNDRLLEIVPTDNYQNRVLRFRRGYITDRIAKEILWAKLKRWEEIVKLTTQGEVFESIIHEFLAAHPDCWQVDGIKRLTDAGTKVEWDMINTVREMLPRAKDRAVRFSTLAHTRLVTHRYMYPDIGNYPVIDALLARTNGTKKTIDLIGLQFTIAKQHPTTAAKLGELLMRLESDFFFTVGDSTIEHKLKLELEANGPHVLVASAQWKVNMSIVYIVQEPEQFQLQTVDTKAGAGLLWSHVAQYVSPPPVYTLTA